ncbi:MAG TPA: hypothetical protein VFG83_08460 [Kofleriaceae bacterium]|nr:hypothetical protein [Kofleriaceae bacterium]
MIALCGCLLSSGCLGTGGPGDTTIDIVYDPCEPVVLKVPESPPGAMAAVADAVAMWNQITPVYATTEVVPGAPILPITFEDAAGAFHGIYLDEDGEIVINRKITDPGALAVTIAHELGHAFGLPHMAADKRPSVMNPGNFAIHPNAGDAADLAALWGVCPEAPASVRAQRMQD